MDALTCQANPGRIDPTMSQILLDKNIPQIEIICPGSCSSGGEVYGLYEGKIATLGAGFYDHVAVPGLCQQTCPESIFQTPPAGSSTYYLVVPNNTKEEGSYCRASSGVERPQPAPLDRCVVEQNLTPCPP